MNNIPSSFEMWTLVDSLKKSSHYRFTLQSNYNYLNRDGSLTAEGYEASCEATLQKMKALFPFVEPSFGVVFPLCPLTEIKDLVGRLEQQALKDRYLESYLDFYDTYPREQIEHLKKKSIWSGTIDKDQCVLNLAKPDFLQKEFPQFPLQFIDHDLEDLEFIDHMKEGKIPCSLGSHFLSEMMNLVIPSLMVFLDSDDTILYKEAMTRFSLVIKWVDDSIRLEKDLKMQRALYAILHQAVRALLAIPYFDTLFKIDSNRLMQEMDSVCLRNEDPNFIAHGYLEKYIPEDRPSFSMIQQAISQLFSNVSSKR